MHLLPRDQASPRVQRKVGFLNMMASGVNPTALKAAERAFQVRCLQAPGSKWTLAEALSDRHASLCEAVQTAEVRRT